jgi:hypothetical protein
LDNNTKCAIYAISYAGKLQRRNVAKLGGWCSLPARLVELATTPRPIGATMPRDRQTPEVLRAFHKAEIDKWWPIIKAAGVKGE